MKKLLVIVLVLVVGYLAVALISCNLLSKKIVECEQKRVGVSLALEKLVGDQLAVSRRMNEIVSSTLGKSKTKVEEIGIVLEDPLLNRMALTYMGADWSVMRSSFIGNVKHIRGLLAMQKEDRKGYAGKLNRKIEELEARKRQLMRRSMPARAESQLYDQAHEQWRLEIEDVDRQLAAFRSSNTYRECIEKDATADKEIEVRARNEAELFKLANDYEEKTIGMLTRVMAENVSSLRFEEAEPARLRHRMSYFNIWPISLIVKMPIGD